MEEIIYFNNNMEVVEKDEATRAVIRTTDENGDLISETWGVIKK